MKFRFYSHCFAQKWALKACRFGVVLGDYAFYRGVVLCRLEAKSVSAGISGSGHTVYSTPGVDLERNKCYSGVDPRLGQDPLPHKAKFFLASFAQLLGNS